MMDTNQKEATDNITGLFSEPLATTAPATTNLSRGDQDLTHDPFAPLRYSLVTSLL
jgi:hypothetical protein